MTSSTGSTASTSTTEKIDMRTREGRARAAAQAEAAGTYSSTEEKARERAHEMVDDTTSAVARGVNAVGQGVSNVISEIGNLSKAMRPYVKPVAYTALTVTDPILGLGTIAVVEGQRVVRRRAREIALAEEANERSE